MLTLSRFEGERICIRCPDGSTIWLVVREIDRSRVRLGFDAPPDVLIDREELLAKKEAGR